uniref:Assembly factor for spindle microtubules n=1 Tax=Erpetoichthys calabaricus TaxID=27687 RepID=A0A8C4SL76_ERPCA
MSTFVAKGCAMDISPTYRGQEQEPKKTNRAAFTSSSNKENSCTPFPVLSLIHFSGTPYVSFEAVKLGSSKSAVLLIDNPNDEVVDVSVEKFPSAKGFSMDKRNFTIQPNAQIPLSIVWTPLEEGGVREIVVFVTNGIVKHQAILLGRAEATKKKKRSMWESIKRKKPPDEIAVRKTHKADIVLPKSANRTFHVSRKVEYTKAKNSHSPVQPCDDILSPSGERVTDGLILRSSLMTREGKALSPIAFVQPQIQTPCTASRLTANTLLYGASVDSVEVEESHLQSETRVQTAFCIKETVSVESTTTQMSCESVTYFENMKNNIEIHNWTLSPVNVSGHVLHTPLSHKRILSPDSFVNNSYVPEVNNDSVLDITILSPDQFLKDGAFVSSSISVLTGHEAVFVSPQSGSSSSNSSSTKEKDLLFTDNRLDQTFSSEPTQSRLTFFVKPDPDIRPVVENPVKDASNKRPVISMTVTKSKSGQIKENRSEPNQKPSFRKCLEDGVYKDGNTRLDQQQFLAFKATTLEGLPIIDSCGGFELRPQLEKDTLAGKLPVKIQDPKHTNKRKSDEFLERTSDSQSHTVEVKKRNRSERVVGETKKLRERVHFSSRSLSSTKTDQQKKKIVAAAMKSVSTITVRKSTNVLHPQMSHKPGIDLKSNRMPSHMSSKRPVIGVAQSKLTFFKPVQTAIPRHPLPFAAKNMFYDERWLEKQERGFTWWINYFLTPDDFKVCTEVLKVNAVALAFGVEGHHKASVPKAPTKEEMSLKTYTARSKLNRLRRAACRLFTSENMVKAIQRLELEVEAKRLLVRKDRHLWKDIGERQKVLNWLLSYNPLWLRIGLETIYGELISLESNSDVMGLAVFILNRLLWNPDIAAEYRHPTVPHLYRDGHEEALSRFTLKKLLLLVCFLDQAKESRLIDHDPCLFCLDSQFKCTKDLLLAFARDFLSGEGILSKHLSYMGLPVSHVQTPLDEFDFAVRNLAVDLKCGVRLVRIVELLTENWSLSSKLRVPVISRLQKMHNVEIALQVLKTKGVNLKDEHGAAIESKDIVDGHREKTLTLLCRIIFTFQVEILLDEQQLCEEIHFLRRAQKLQRILSGLQSSSKKAFLKEDTEARLDSGTKVKLLMEWVNAVCAFYNTKVENFTVSFSDGRVLCFLINYYHPSYLTMEAIRQKTTQTVECGHRGTIGLNQSSSDSDDSSLNCQELNDTSTISVNFKELLENEKTNFQLVNNAVSNLGGVPAMINSQDMSNTIPNEKVVICYLSFLCARLLDLCKETRAARVIQTAWRKYKLKLEQKKHEERNHAACIIQMAVLKFLNKCREKKKIAAAIIIQSFWRGYLVRKKAREDLLRLQNESATIIQAYWKRYSAMKHYRHIKHCIIMLQARVRMKIAHSAYKKILQAVVTIQRRHRANLLAKGQRRHYLVMKASAVLIGRCYRRWKSRMLARQNLAALVIQCCFRQWRSQVHAKRNMAAIHIQAYYRMYSIQKHFMNIQRKIVKIQAWFRGCMARRKFNQMRTAVLTIQRHYKAFVCGKAQRQKFLLVRKSVVVIQSYYRGMKGRLIYRQIKAACVIASFWQMKKERARFLLARQSVVILQSHVRTWQARRRYQRLKRSVSLIQACYRAVTLGRKVRESFQSMKLAAIVLQAACRGWQARRRRHMLKSVVRIQSVYRAYVAQKKFLKLKQATITIQANVKMVQTQQRYTKLRNTAIYIQRTRRANQLCTVHAGEFRRKRKACIVLQAAARGYVVRKQIQTWRIAAVKIQSAFRMKKERACYLSKYKAVLVLQKHYRCYREGIAYRSSFLRVRAAAMCLQAAYRGFRLRQTLKRLHKSASVIQRAFRACVLRRRFLEIKKSTILIQRWYRACILGVQQRVEHRKLKVSSIAIQAIYRGKVVRTKIQKWHKAALVIQTCFRRYQAEKNYHALKNATIFVQKRFQAKLAGGKQQEKYLALRHCALKLQAAWRGKTVRRRLQVQHQAVTLIQNCYRTYVLHRKWKTMRLGAVRIQQAYRAYTCGKKQRVKFLRLREAAVILQAGFRGMKVRQRLQAHHRAACKIQAAYKTFKAKTKFNVQKTAAICIQRRYRAMVVGQIQRQKYVQLLQATIKLQSIYRGVKLRRMVQQQHVAATAIQAYFRMHKAQCSYLAMRLAAPIIQVNYRAHLKRKEEREKYLHTRKSVIFIQSAYRGMRDRRILRERHKAASVIQAHYRKWRRYIQFKKLKWAVMVVQRRFKANCLRNIEVGKYKTIQRATICIQAAFRGMKARCHLKHIQAAAQLIQHRYRCYLQHKRYVVLRCATVTIQRRYRALIVARQQQNSYHALRTAAITLQAAYRGLKCRKTLKRQQRAAVVIQSAFRMYKAKIPFKAMKLAAIMIQTCYKAYLKGKTQRNLFLTYRKSAVIIQSAYRGMKVRQELTKIRCAAVIIQAWFRAHKQRWDFQILRSAAVVLQQRYRAQKLKVSGVEQYRRTKQAVVCIQKAFRVWQARQLVRRETAAVHIQSFLKMYVQRRAFLRQKAAAVVIQSAFKCYKARACYKEMCVSSLVIQKWYRSSKETQLQRAQYLEMKKAAILLQSVFRGIAARKLAKQKSAACKIQSFLQMAICRRNFKEHRSAAITIQAHYKACIARRKYESYRRAALVLQKHYRAFLIMKQQRLAYVTTVKRLQMLQARIRGFITRQRLKRLQKGATVIQALFRGRMQRRQFLQYKRATEVIQAHYRAYLLQKMEKAKYLRMKESAIVIQAHIRGYQTRQHILKIKAAQNILAWYRGCVVRREYRMRQKAIVTVHRCIRTKLLRRRFLKLHHCACIIQKRWRETMQARMNHLRFLQLRTSTVTIQAAWRGYRTRKLFFKMQRSALLIQAFYRGFVQRRDFLRKQKAVQVIENYFHAWQRGRLERSKFQSIKNATITLQAFCRGWLVRKKMIEQKQAEKRMQFSAAAYHHMSAIKIQRNFRAYLVLKRAKQQIHSVICIQRWMRVILQRRQFLNKRENIIKIQRSARVWLLRRSNAAAVIQKAVKNYLCKKQKEAFLQRVIKVQATWRGFWSRKMNDTRTVVAIRHRLEKANRESKEEEKLCNKTATAIDYLMRYRHLSYILAALKHLETATRLSSVCCEKLADSGATLTIFTLIRSCNRSVPCMEVITYAIQVLLNLSKYDKTVGAVYNTEHSIKTLLELLRIYREKAGDKVADKGGTIFTKTCFLLVILLQDPRRALEVRNLPKAVENIRSIYNLTSRKHMMDSQRTITKQKMNASFNGSFLTPATPIKAKLTKRVAPDWLLRKDSLKEVVDPLRAIQMVASALCISI